MYLGDAYFVMGKDHLICQDFASAGTLASGRTVAVLSDGCSKGGADGRGLDVDIGSRLLVKALIQTLSAWQPPAGVLGCRHLSAVIQQALRKALSCAQRLGLDPSCLSATLSAALVVGERAYIVMAGDGVCFFRSKAGLAYGIVEFAGNAPCYPYYRSSKELNRRYLATCAPDGRRYGTYRLRGFEPKLGPYERECEPAHCHVFSAAVAELSCFGVISDGLLSGVRASGAPSALAGDHEHLVQKLTQFPNLNGPFATRRLNKFIKESRAEGLEFSDDLALAVLARPVAT